MQEGKDRLKILDTEIGPEDVMPGRFSDPYFFAALINILEKPQLIADMFINKEVNDGGAYALSLTKNGQRRTVLIDDTIPVSGNESAFCHERRGLLWVPLLNKAWAKLHGSYD